MAEDFQKWLSTHTFTPSELEDYLLCPYRFYASAYLKIEHNHTWEKEINPADRGLILHSILEKFLSTCHNQLTENNKDILKKKISDLLDHEVKELSQKCPALSPFLLERQKTSMQRALTQFVDQFLQEKRKTLKPKYFEWSFEIETPVRLKGRIDRIDIDPVQKRFLVIDYKTGSRSISGQQILQGKSLQLPLYILAVQKLLLPDYEPIGGLYYHLSEMTQKDGMLHADRLPDFLEIHPSSTSLIPSQKWESLLEDTKKRVVEIVSEIRKGDFPSQKDPCEDFCSYQDICRIRTQSC